MSAWPESMKVAPTATFQRVSLAEAKLREAGVL